MLIGNVRIIWPMLALIASALAAALAPFVLARWPELRARVGGHSGTLALAGILLLAAALRLYLINQPLTDAFSWRQTSTAMMADNFYRRNWNIFFPEVSWNGPGESYQGREFQTVSYTAALLYLLVGQQDWVGRSVAVVFGVWGVFALYQLIRRVWDEPRALAGAAVMAVMSASVFTERSFLPDPAMVSLVTTCAWLMVAYVQTDQRRYLLLGCLAGGLGFLSKIPGLIVGLPILYAALTILAARGLLSLRRFAVLAGAGLVTMIPVVAYYLWARNLALSYPPYHFAGSGNWLWDQGLAEWLAQSYYLDRVVVIGQYWFWALPVALLLLLGIVILPPGARGQASSGAAPWFFHAWLAGMLVYYLIGARELTENPWNFHIVNPAVAALAGHAIFSLALLGARALRTPLLIPAACAALCLAIGLAGQSQMKNMYRMPWGNESYELGLALRQAAQPGDLVVTLSSDLGDPNVIYYSQRRGWTFPPASNEIDWSVLPEDAQGIRMFEELRASGADWLGIAAEQFEPLWQEHPTLASHIERSAELHLKTDSYIIYAIQPSSAGQP